MNEKSGCPLCLLPLFTVFLPPLLFPFVHLIGQYDPDRLQVVTAIINAFAGLQQLKDDAINVMTIMP